MDIQDDENTGSMIPMCNVYLSLLRYQEIPSPCWRCYTCPYLSYSCPFCCLRIASVLNELAEILDEFKNFRLGLRSVNETKWTSPILEVRGVLPRIHLPFQNWYL